MYSWSVDLKKFDLALPLPSNNGSLYSPFPVKKLQQLLNFSLIPTRKILICYVGVILKCLTIKFKLLTESKQTKAWPELTNGLIVSSFILFSNLSHSTSYDLSSLYFLGMKHSMHPAFWTAKSIFKSFKSYISASIASYAVKSGIIKIEVAFPGV